MSGIVQDKAGLRLPSQRAEPCPQGGSAEIAARGQEKLPKKMGRHHGMRFHYAKLRCHRQRCDARSLNG